MCPVLIRMCARSVIYVCVVVVGLFLTCLVTCCCLKCRRRRRKRGGAGGSRGQKYARLGNGDMELTGE